MAKVVKEDLDTKNNGTAAEATLAPNSKPGGSPEKSKTELMADVVATMGGVEHGDLTKFLESLKMNTGANQSKGEAGDQSKNRASITPKGVASQAMKEDVIEMFKGQEGMTEELMTKATVLFEAAVNVRVGLETTRIQEELEKKSEDALKEELQTVVEELNDKLDKYVTYAVKEWQEENQVAIDNSIKAEIAIDFLKAQRKLFKEHYIKIPKKKTDVVEQLSAQNDELVKKLDEVTKSNIEMTEQLNAVKRHQVVETCSVGLSVTQVEKLKTLSEGVEFVSEEDLKKKLNILKESYFGVKAPKENLLTETTEKTILVNDKGEHVNERGEVIQKPAESVASDNPEMKAYNDAINRSVRII